MNPVSLVRPPALKPGDRVAVLCASSPVEPGALAAGLDALRFAGLDPVTYPSVHDPGTMRPYLAGDDAMRAGDLRSALTDPGIAGILFARGGSGAQRTLEAMDWDGLAGQPPKAWPAKILAGYSDVTALLEAVAVRLGRHGLRRPERRAGPPRLAHASQSRAVLATDERDVPPDPGQPSSQAAPGVTMGHNARLPSSCDPAN